MRRKIVIQPERVQTLLAPSGPGAWQVQCPKFVILGEVSCVKNTRIIYFIRRIRRFIYLVVWE